MLPVRSLGDVVVAIGADFRVFAFADGARDSIVVLTEGRVVQQARDIILFCSVQRRGIPRITCYHCAE